MSFDIKPVPDLLPEIKESASSKNLLFLLVQVFLGLLIAQVGGHWLKISQRSVKKKD